MAVITRIRPPQSLARFTLPARLAVGVITVLAGAALGVAVGFGLSQTMLILGLIAPFALVFVLARPHWAAIVYVALVYGDLLSILVKFHGMPALARFAGLALLSAVLGYRLFVQRERLASDRVTGWMLAYGAMVALGLLYARAPDLVMTNVIEFVRNFFTYLIIVNIITTSSRLHAALYSVMGVGTALAALTLFQSLTGTFDNDYGGLAQYRVSDITEVTEAARPGGTIGDANYYGQMLLILVPIALYLFFEGRTRMGRMVGLGCAAILSAAVVFTYSRGDAVALGAMVVAIVIYKKPKPIWIVGGIIALIMAVPFLPSNYLARLTTVLGVAGGDQQLIINEDSIRGRAGATQAAIEIFFDHPILGVGRENYPLYQLEYISGTAFARVAKGIPPHNLYLEVAAEQGIVGLFIFGGLLFVTFGALRDARKRFQWAGRTREKELVAWLAIMLIGYLISSLALHGAFLYMLWLQISLIVATRQIAKRHTAAQIGPWTYEPATPRAGGIALQPPGGAETEQPARKQAGFPARVAAVLTGFVASVSTAAGALRSTLRPKPKPTEEPSTMFGQIIPPAQPQPQYTAQAINDPQAGYPLGDRNPQSEAVWLAAADDALARGDLKVARAMSAMALERDPYSEAAWAMRMRVRQAREGTPTQADLYDYVTEAAARSAFQVVGEEAELRHEISEKLYTYWFKNGGVPVFGYPISPRFAEVTSEGNIIEVQYFERSRLEYHPRNQGTPFEVVPGKLGLEVPIRGAVSVQLPRGLEGEQVIFTARGTGMPTPRKFFSFWEGNGGPDIFGYPITPLLIDIDTQGHQLAVQYFEKARLEYHPQLSGTVYEVQVSRLGTLVFASRYGRKQ